MSRFGPQARLYHAEKLQPLTLYRGKNAAPTFIRWVFGVERWACPNCRSDIFVTIRVVKPAFTALMFIGPPLADIAAKMPLLPASPVSH